MRYLLFISILFSFLFSDLLKPENEITLSSIHILFEWEQEADAIEYNIQISNDELFENILLDINHPHTLYIEKNIIGWDSTFFWRVRPIYNNQLYGEWINQSKFDISSPLLQEIDVTMYNENLLEDGLIIFGQFSPTLLIGVIDELGNEIWNSLGGNIENGLVAFLNYVSDYGQLFAKRSYQGINFNYNNDILWESPSNTEIDGHEIQQLPNNNYMSFVPVYQLGPIVEDERWTPLFQSLGYEADGETLEFPWLAQKLVEWDKDTGEEVWSWNPFDYLTMDERDVGGELWNDAFISGRFDWLHSNSFDFDPIESVIYISHRHLNRICKIAYPSGEILWNIGLPEEYNMGSENICTNLLFSWQHHVQLLEDGDLLFFDNGNLSELLMGDESPISRVRRIKVNDNYTCDTVWQYDLPDYLFGPGTGSVQLLNNGNYSIYTLGGYENCSILEVTPDKELIWMAEASNPESSFYRSYKIPSIYPDAFSIKANNFILNNSNSEIQVENNQINFTIYNQSGYMQDYLYSFSDSGNNMFLEQEGEFNLEPNESIVLSFNVNNEEIDLTNIILKVTPIYHQYAEKELMFNISNLNLNNNIINDFKITKIYPNPFNPTTTISYNIIKMCNVKISVYNANGQLIEVLDEKLHEPGEYNINWNAESYTSGIYFVKLIVENSINTQKIMLIK